MSDQTPPPKKRNCWLFGCIGLAVFTLAGIIITFFVIRSVVLNAVDKYTATEPLSIQRVELPPNEMTNLLERVSNFGDALEKQDHAEELVLTANEINALIGRQKDLADKLLVGIEGDKLSGQVSFPLESLGFKGRYFNGEATFRAQVEGGRLEVFIDDASFNGQSLPDNILKQLRKEDMMKEVDDPEFKEAIAKFESIQVKDGQIICRNRVATPEPAVETTPP